MALNCTKFSHPFCHCSLKYQLWLKRYHAFIHTGWRVQTDWTETRLKPVIENDGVTSNRDLPLIHFVCVMLMIFLLFLFYFHGFSLTAYIWNDLLCVKCDIQSLLSLGDENITLDWLGNNVRLISFVHATHCHWQQWYVHDLDVFLTVVQTLWWRIFHFSQLVVIGFTCHLLFLEFDERIWWNYW